MDELLLFLHLVSAVAAFGPPLVLPRFTREAPRRAAGHVVVVLQRIVTPGLVGLLLFGAALVGSSDADFSFSEAWISLAFLTVLAALAVVWLVLIPRERRVARASSDSEANRLARQTGGLFGLLHLLLVIGLVLMVWQPGR
jgi:membrane protein YdbS with pleckstrin-like domain